MDVEVAKNWRCDGDVRYGTSVRVGRYVPIGNSRHGAFSSDGQAIMQLQSNGWIPSSPARACVSASKTRPKDLSDGWLAFARGRREKRWL